jgi:hypothetical protein
MRPNNEVPWIVEITTLEAFTFLPTFASLSANINQTSVTDISKVIISNMCEGNG